MKTRIVHTKIWHDEWFCRLSLSSQHVFLYLLTCPYNNICGKFECSDRVMLFEIGLTQKQLDQAKTDLHERVVFYNGWIRLLHTERYNNYVTNPKMEIALQREISFIPEEINRVLDEYDTSIHTSIYTPNNHKSIIIKDKSVREGNVSPKEMEQIAIQYRVPFSFVQSKYDDMQNWLKAKGKTYRDYAAALRNWVKRDAGTHKIVSSSVPMPSAHLTKEEQDALQRKVEVLREKMTLQ